MQQFSSKLGHQRIIDIKGPMTIITNNVLYLIFTTIWWEAIFFLQNVLENCSRLQRQLQLWWWWMCVHADGMFDTDGLCHDWARLGHSVQHYSRPAKKAVIQPVLRSAASASLYCWIAAAAACRPTLLAAAGLISYTGCLDTTFFHVGVPWLVIQGDLQAWKNYRGWLDTTSSFWKVPWLVIQGDQFRECLDTTFLCQKVFWSTSLIGC